MLKDNEWGAVDGEPCRVIKFTPLASVERGRVVTSNRSKSYASIILECRKVSRTVEGFVTHKMDFKHLWAAFKERGVGQEEEVIILWSKKHLRGYAKVLSVFMPKLWVMICPKGAFEMMTDSSWKPELTGEARWDASKPIVEWKPAVIK